MTKEKIAIIFTTFLRDALMKKTLQSISDNWNDNYVLLIGNQNKEDMNNNLFHNLWEKIPNKIFHYKLPYDCGLSYARNYLVDKAHDMGIKYCLITADSIQFDKKYDFEETIEMLEFYPKLSKIGFNLENRQNFTYDLEIHPKHNKFVVIKPRREPFLTNNVEYTPCDIHCNFFIAKTAILHKKELQWDNNLGLCEHEDFSFRLKQAGYYSLWTNNISATYIKEQPDKYKQMRTRLYGEFKNKLKEKYNFDPMGSWLVYDEKINKGKK